MQANVQGAAFALAGSPSGAILSGNTITWTPTSLQSRTADQFSVTASYAGSTATQSWTVTPTGSVRGTTANTCFEDSGQTVTTFYANADTLQILVPNSAGAFDRYSGIVAQDGTFSIPNVPAGSFWLMMAPSIRVWTDSSAINLGYTYWGSCLQESNSSAGTALQVSASGLSQPFGGYYFYFLVPNQRVGIPTPNLPAGTTSFSETVPYINLPLLESENGDNAYVAQLASGLYSGIFFQSLQQFFGPLPVSVQNGATTSLSAVLQPVPQDRVVRANVRGSAFAALYSSMPRAMEANPSNNFIVDITADSQGPASNGLYLVLASHGFNTDFDAGDIPYANPYPATWTPYLDYMDFGTQNLTPPGASTPVPIVLVNEVITTNFPTASSPIAPLIGPALNPLIDGVDLFQDQIITGTTPTISWQPPALGTASIYFLGVQQFSVTNGGASFQVIGEQVSTTNTSITLPQGLISSGNSYYFTINSISRKSLDGSVAPYAETFPEGSAELVSGVITVQ